ncbi:pyrroline-5-carboxylate reductase [Candidatus Poribacteria bacterium]|nr:pyrroline-5-carboxylate reductase [Candidatus Poribacteria bacterium]MYB66404.1 pyrroline-5-carboxylate reductase [Candidatus Poribacteria bacterium]MYF55786.1 pyrroline-5-carboxylate reductase [Candidatus Poribacteria bacterium]
MVLDDLKLGVIGVGKMGGIIVRRIVDSTLTPQQIWITDIDTDLVTQLCSELKVNSTKGAAPNIEELLDNTDVVLCAVPPVAVPKILPQVAKSLTPTQWIVSIAAGVTTKTLESYCVNVPPIVRVMPNIAASVGEAISVLTAGSAANEKHINIAQALFRSCGTTLVLAERHLNAVTGLSGSGPAYVALFIEALADAGVHVGLPRQESQTLAIHTVLGTATMLSESLEHPAILKNRVTTPGGTTAAGLHELENGGLRATLAKAIIAATERARQLDSDK